jgi:hypothetical protein
MYSWLSKWLQTDLHVPSFKHATDLDTVSATTKQSEDEEEGSEAQRNSVHINHSVWTLCYSMSINESFNIMLLQLPEKFKLR